MRQPPSGHTITPTPFGLAGLNTLSVGSDTLRSIAASPAVPTGPRNVTSGPTPSSLDGGPSGQRRITSSGDALTPIWEFFSLIIFCHNLLTASFALSTFGPSPT